MSVLSPVATMPNTKVFSEERFWNKVERTTDCWLWRGGIRPDGYGNFWLDGKTVAAHRVSYKLMVAPIPDNLEIDHLCRNRSCVNPAHLEAVPRSVNITRGDLANRRKTHCKNGHPFNEDNTYLYTNKHGITSRYCRACNRQSHRVEEGRDYKTILEGNYRERKH